MRVSIPLPSDAPFDATAYQGLAISRDGHHLAYSSAKAIYVRSLSDDGFRMVPGTERGVPLLSPDGLWIGVVNESGLHKVPLSGGAPVPILALPNTTLFPWDWSLDDEVLFGSFTTGVMAVSAAGGSSRQLVAPHRTRGELLVGFAQRLPGSSDLLFTVCGDSIASPDDCQIVLQDPAEPAKRAVLVNGTASRYLRTGHLMFARAASILAAPIDLRARRLNGPSQTVVPGVAMNAATGWLHAAVSDTGTLAYMPGSMGWAGPSSLVMADRHGTERPLGRPQPFAMCDVSVSRDGARAAVRMGRLNDDIHVLDIAAGTFARATFDAGNESSPVWAPDGKSLIYTTTGGIARRSLDGLTTPQIIGPPGSYPSSVSSDGRWLLYNTPDRQTGSGYDIWRVPLDGERTPEALTRTRWNDQSVVFSPDGQWVAYESDESGRAEIYVARFPDMTSRRQVSVDGGTAPLWSPRGDELFFRDADRLMAVAITARDQVQSRAPTIVLQHAFKGTLWGRVQYAVLPDGQHFIFPRNPLVEPVREIRLIANWYEELKAKVPTGR